MRKASASPRPLWLDLVLITFAAILFLVMIALGTWQLQRLSWKQDLIAAVNARAFGDAAVSPKGTVNADTHAYMRVYAEGEYLHDQSLEVKALTELGGGKWLLTPLKTRDAIVWVNRGFLPSLAPDIMIDEPRGQIRVEGLLRITEPDGTVLEKNDPQNGLWFSRDVAAMSAAVGIDGYRPYFIDADHLGVANAWPRGGLTNVKFRNSHLSYAITWYAMAALFLCAIVYVVYLRVTNSILD